MHAFTRPPSTHRTARDKQDLGVRGVLGGFNRFPTRAIDLSAVQTLNLCHLFPFLSTGNSQTPQLLHRRDSLWGCSRLALRAEFRATTECDVQSAPCLGRPLEENSHASARLVRSPSRGFVTRPQPEETPPCRPVRLKVSELTGLGWRNGGEGSSSAIAGRAVAHL